MKRLRVAIDMDEVIADTYGAMLGWLEARSGRSWTPAERSGVQLDAIADRVLFDELIAVMKQGDFFADLAVIDGAVEALKALDLRYEVFITSAAMEFPRSLGAKFDWLRRHFPFLDPLNFVFCGDKSIIHADWLIDDNARHFRRFAGEGILFSSPHNAGITGFARLDAWKAAVPLLAGLEEAKLSVAG